MPKLARLSKFAGLMVLWLPMAATASQSAQRFAISTQQVVDAMAAAGLTANLTQVEFLSEVSTSSDHAAIQMVNMAHRSIGRALVKLRCHDNQECLPFYVVVRGVKNTPPIQHAGERRPAIETASFPQIIRGGDRAILILESADYRISLPVVCLQDGARGQKIRVSSRDHRRFFEGEVIGTGMLKGRL